MMYILLAIVLMFMDQRGHYVPKVRGVLELALEPVFHIVAWPAEVIRSVEDHTRARADLIAENQRLQQQLLENSGFVQTQAALEQENQRLRDLLKATQGRDYNFQFSEIIRVDLDPFSHKIWIDRGINDAVLVGQAVIDGLGIVGQVEDVHRHYSTVRLISDPIMPYPSRLTGLVCVPWLMELAKPTIY